MAGPDRGPPAAAAGNGQLVRSRATGISPLLAQELTRLAAAAFLVTFPSTTMTVGYLPGPGWVPLTIFKGESYVDFRPQSSHSSW